MHRRAAFSLVVPLLASSGCKDNTGPYRGMETRLEVDAVRARAGEMLGLRAIATNYGDETVELGAGCGLGLDFEVQRPSGERHYLLRDLPSLCPIFDSNILEPGETDTVAYAWPVPLQTGTYRIWAGGRVPEGLVARSAPREVVVE